MSFYVIEYTDGDGELVIKHEFMTSDEAQKLIETMADNGVVCSISDLSPPPQELPEPIDVDGIILR